MEWYFYSILAAILVSILSLIEKKTLFFEHAMQFSATLAFVNMIIAAPFFFVIDYSRLQFLPILIIFFGTILKKLCEIINRVFKIKWIIIKQNLRVKPIEN